MAKNYYSGGFLARQMKLIVVWYSLPSFLADQGMRGLQESLSQGCYYLRAIGFFLVKIWLLVVLLGLTPMRTDIQQPRIIVVYDLSPRKPRDDTRDLGISQVSWSSITLSCPISVAYFCVA